MAKSLDSLLILVVAVGTAAAAGVTIHDANTGTHNPIPGDLRHGVSAVVSWFHRESAALQSSGAGEPRQGGLSGSHTVTGDGSPTNTVQSLTQQWFGAQGAMVPAVGTVGP